MDIEGVRAKEIDEIAHIIGLTKEGRRRYRCPFCQSGTRSNASGFYVRGNTYKCYSCGVSGDTINLVMEIGRYNFQDAVEVIAGTGVTFKRKQKIELFLRCELPGVKTRGWKITPFQDDLLKHLAISNTSIYSLSLPISKIHREDIRILFNGSYAFFPEEMSRADDRLYMEFSELETIYFFTAPWFSLIKKIYYSFYDGLCLGDINELSSRIRLDRSFFNEVFELMLDTYRVRPVQILAH